MCDRSAKAGAIMNMWQVQVLVLASVEIGVLVDDLPMASEITISTNMHGHFTELFTIGQNKEANLRRRSSKTLSNSSLY